MIYIVLAISSVLSAGVMFGYYLCDTGFKVQIKKQRGFKHSQQLRDNDHYRKMWQEMSK